MLFNLLLIVSSVSLNVGAQVLLKKSVLGLGEFGLEVSGPQLAKMVLALGTNIYLWLALFAYALSLGLWIVTLSRVNLSIAYPFQSLGYVLATCAGYFLFHEPLTYLKLFGISVIMLGVLLLALSGELS